MKKSELGIDRAYLEKIVVSAKEESIRHFDSRVDWGDDDEVEEPPPWRSPMFHFVRLLRFHPVIRGVNLKPEVLAEVVEEILADLSQDCQDDPWSVFDSQNEAASMDQFLKLWFTVRIPVDFDPIDEAAWRTDHEEEWVYEATDKTRPSIAPFRRFISIAAHLQILCANLPVALPTSKLADILGDRVDRNRVGAMRENAVRDGVLVPVAIEGVPVSPCCNPCEISSGSG